jgi:hypothetical protein
MPTFWAAFIVIFFSAFWPIAPVHVVAVLPAESAESQRPGPEQGLIRVNIKCR